MSGTTSPPFLQPVSYYLGLITSYHADKPDFMATVQALIAPAQAMATFLDTLPTVFDLDTAIGVQLDACGQWIGRTRYIAEPITNVYFSWATLGLGWNQGYWQGKFEPSTGLVELDDGAYRLLLQSKAACNVWNGTNGQLPAILNIMFPASSGTIVTINDNQDMTMSVGVSGPAGSVVALAILAGGYIPIQPEGVSIDYYQSGVVIGAITGVATITANATIGTTHVSVTINGRATVTANTSVIGLYGTATLPGVATVTARANVLSRGAATIAGVGNITIVPANVATTWSPTDEVGMALSNNNLTATSNTTSASGVRSTSSRLGAYYAEVTLTTANIGETVGIANGTWSETNANGVGGDLNSIGLRENGSVYINNVAVGTAMAAWTPGTVLGIALNTTAATVGFTYNGTAFSSYSISTLTGGPYKVAFGAPAGASAPAGVSGIQYNSASANLFGNPNFTGGTIGGALPTGFIFSGDTGLTATLTAVGTTPQGVPYCEVQISGTAASTNVQLFFASIAASAVSTTVSYGYAIAGGSTSNITSFSNFWNQYNVSTYLGQAIVTLATPTSALQRTTLTATNPANTTLITPCISLVYSVGAAINITLEIAGVEIGTPTQPVVIGPATAAVGVSAALPIVGIYLADSNQPLGGTCALDISTANGGLVTVTPVTTGSVTGNGTASLTVADSFPNCVLDAATLVYTSTASTGSDTLTVTLWDQLGLNNTINIAVTVEAGAVSVKTINAGEQAFAYAVPSVPWDNYAPSAPQNLGTLSITSTAIALTWVAPAVGTAPITYTVQYRLHGASIWTNFATGVTVTSSSVTGLTVSTSYDFQVIAVNALGNAVAPFITASTTASGGGGGDPTGTTAYRIADMLESFGVNCFFNNQDGAIGYNDYPNIPTLAQIAANYLPGFQYLTANTGMGLTCRIYTDGTSTTTEQNQITIANSLSSSLPVKWTSCWSWTNAATQAVVNGIIAAGNLAFAEGVNEPDPSGNTNEPVADCLAQQQFVWTTWNATQQVAAPSVTDSGSNTYEADYYGTSLATVAGQCTLWNGHDYPNGGAPSQDIYRRTLMIGANIGFPANGIITEFHPLLYNTPAAKAGGDTYSAYYLGCALLAGFVYYNVKALIWFDMFDYQYNYTGPGGPPFSYPVGLFEAYTTATPRYPATVIHNFFNFCADASATRHTFTPGKINYTIAGLPAAWTGSFGGVTSTKASGGGQSALFEGANGIFYLFVWNEQNTMATGTTAAVTVTFNSGAKTKVVDISLTNPAGTENPAPIQTLTNVSTVHMNVTTEVRVLVITP